MERKERLWLLFILGLIAFDLGSALYWCRDFTTDDAFISWRYARQLAEGHGLLWQSGQPPVEGYSNFLWVLLSALVIKAKLPLIASMKLFSIAFLCSGLFFLYRLSRMFLEPMLAIMPVFLFSHYIGVVWWTMSGLETTLFWALVVFAYVQILGNTSWLAVISLQLR